MSCLHGNIIVVAPTEMYLRDIIYTLSTSDLNISIKKHTIYGDNDNIGKNIYIAFEKEVDNETYILSDSKFSLEFSAKIRKVLKNSNIKYFSIIVLFGARGGTIDITCSNIKYPD